MLGKLGTPGLDPPLSVANTWHSIMKPRAKQLLEQVGCPVQSARALSD